MLHVNPYPARMELEATHSLVLVGLAYYRTHSVMKLGYFVLFGALSLSGRSADTTKTGWLGKHCQKPTLAYGDNAAFFCESHVCSGEVFLHGNSTSWISCLRESPHRHEYKPNKTSPSCQHNSVRPPEVCLLCSLSSREIGFFFGA